jgi:hypothetical protein
MVERSDLIIVARHLSISMEKENPRPVPVPGIKSAADRDSFIHWNQQVEGPLRAGSGISPGIEKKG